MAANKKLYALVHICNGKETESINTTDFSLAQKKYQKCFRTSGTTPRVFVNGKKLTICESDKLFGLQHSSPWRGNKSVAELDDEPEDEPEEQKYTDKHVKIAQQKKRTSHEQPRGGGRV